MTQSVTPREINVESYRLRVTWTDGHVSEYPMRYLRQWCRCAACVNELSGEEMLDKASVPEAIRCLKAEPMGHYGVAMSFSDMHKTGIYTYAFLRELCPCEMCKLSTH